MSNIVGHEDIPLGDHVIEGQWEVNADTKDAIPYLLVGTNAHDAPFGSISWHTSNEIAAMRGADVYTGTNDENDMPICIHVATHELCMRLAQTMNRISEDVSLADLHVN